MPSAAVRASLCAITSALAGLVSLTAPPARAASPASGTVSDSLYVSLHPRLLFDRAELPAWRARLRDGGRDDEAYAFIHHLVDSLYPASPLGDLMAQTYGMHFLLHTGLVSHLDDPPDDAARELGRSLTIAVADSFAADDNTFYGSIRLRMLACGYDMCMETATPAERAYLRQEIESYVDSLMYAFNFERWLHPPYTSNISAMIGSSLGLAAICLADEMEPARVSAALARADSFVAVWKRNLLDPGGAYREGVQYAAWSMHHLAAYFHARLRYDGVDYSRDPALRAMETWLAHELLPEPGGVVNNLNDTAYLNHPLSRHNTYLDWAMSAWSSGVAAWLWERTLGDYGYDWGLNVDRAATVLWWRPLPPVSPAAAVPRSLLWRQRGLYYYRTGWPDAAASDDVVFSFYSGEFRGGHSQQDQNSFTLYAGGNRFAADNGFDTVNWRSEAHNMIFIDGAGQHWSGASVGTDGRMAEHILGGFADYLLGDAATAYTTHSPLNAPGFPFPDDDWSYGYSGANPVEYASRRWIVVHEGVTPPYFILLDDIRKDDATHDYDWRMHTELPHAIDLAPHSIRLTAPNGVALQMDLLPAAGGAPAVRTETFANPSADPDTRVIVLSQRAVAGRFAMVLRPARSGDPVPIVTRVAAPWGGAARLDWPSGVSDIVLANADRDTAAADAAVRVATDARLAQLRFTRDAVSRGVLVDASFCDVGETRLLRTPGAPVSLLLDGDVVHVLNASDLFTLYAPAVTSMMADGQPVPFTRSGAYVSRGSDTPALTPSRLGVRAYPSPFTSHATIAVDSPAPAPAEVVIYDVRGRAVRRLWSGTLTHGRTLISWDGRNDGGEDVSSGVYFVRARSAADGRVSKLVRVR